MLPKKVLGMLDHYSTKKISDALIAEIKEALENLDYGSVELYVQDSTVTQITRRHIKKIDRLTGSKKK